MRKVTFSGGAARVTIPPVVKEMLEIEEDDRIVFIWKGGLIFIENPKRLSVETLYEERIVRMLKLIKEKYKIAKRLIDNVNKYASGKMDRARFSAERVKIEEKLEELNKIFERISSGLPSLNERDLRFVSTNRTDELLTLISIEGESEMEENFRATIDFIKSVKEEVNEMKGLLKKIEEGKNQGRIPREDYEVLRERYLGRLMLAETRLKKLKDVLCV